jgi:hypothetical protein
MVAIYSIIPSLRNELGHFFEYNLALSKAARINNFKHIKIIPKTAELPKLDDTWQRSIYEIYHQKKWKNIKNIIPFIKVFRKMKKEKSVVIFLEDFNLIILMLIVIASVFIRPNAELWLFHRFEYDKTFLKGKAYKFAHFLFEMIFSKVKYLTDSELIKNLNGSFFNKTFYVFPIPHIYFSEEKKQTSNNIKYFWWPGGLIREEKGLGNIKKIINFLKDSDNIKIVIADSAKNLFSNSCIYFINNNLSRKEYEKWMVDSDLILLPYVSDLYRYRTSGIFVEAIASGSIPVVSKNTWMSYELEKYHLNELAINFDSLDIIQQLKSITDNLNVKNKLRLMKQSYEKIHSIENYAFVIKSVYDQKV